MLTPELHENYLFILVLILMEGVTLGEYKIISWRFPIS